MCFHSKHDLQSTIASCIVICYRIIWWNVFLKTVTHIIVAVVHNKGLSVDVAQRTTPSALSGTSRLCCVSLDGQFHLPLVDVLALGQYCVSSALTTSWKLHYAFIEWELLRIKFVERKCESTTFHKTPCKFDGHITCIQDELKVLIHPVIF